MIHLATSLHHSIRLDRPSLKRALGLLCLILLTACATTKEASQTPGSLPTGRWEGQLHWHSSVPFEGKTSGVLEAAFVNCGEAVIYWKNDGVYGRGKETLRSISHLTSHIAYSVSQSRGNNPAWVETHSWALVELPSDELTVSWSRSVNNRLEDRNDPERSFAQVGIGKFRKLSENCAMPGWPAVKN